MQKMTKRMLVHWLRGFLIAFGIGSLLFEVLPWLWSTRMISFWGIMGVTSFIIVGIFAGVLELVDRYMFKPRRVHDKTHDR